MPDQILSSQRLPHWKKWIVMDLHMAEKRFVITASRERYPLPALTDADFVQLWTSRGTDQHQVQELVQPLAGQTGHSRKHPRVMHG
jgi:hypothetical protein